MQTRSRAADRVRDLFFSIPNVQVVKVSNPEVLGSSYHVPEQCMQRIAMC